MGIRGGNQQKLRKELTYKGGIKISIENYQSLYFDLLGDPPLNHYDKTI